MIFLEETMKNTATEFTQNSVMSTILIATDWIRDRVSRKQKAGPRNGIRVDGIPDNDKRPGQLQKKKSETFLRKKIGPWFGTRGRESSLLGSNGAPSVSELIQAT